MATPAAQSSHQTLEALHRELLTDKSLQFRFEQADHMLRQVLCLGAHCDDLEIGCSGTVLRLLESRTPPAVTWVIFASDPVREAEALRAAEAVLERSAAAKVIIHKFRDGFLPYEGKAVKELFEELTVPGKLVTTREAIHYLDRNKALAKRNIHLNHKAHNVRSVKLDAAIAGKK